MSSDLTALTLELSAVRDCTGLSVGLAVMGWAICVLRRLNPSIAGAALRGTGWGTVMGVGCFCAIGNAAPLAPCVNSSPVWASYFWPFISMTVFNR
jgi:hypothetical protein